MKKLFDFALQELCFVVLDPIDKRNLHLFLGRTKGSTFGCRLGKHVPLSLGLDSIMDPSLFQVFNETVGVLIIII
eukprot:5243082-Ditylum_brightwellii.AAC.1